MNNMLNKAFITQLKKDYLQNIKERKIIISVSNSLLYDSKRVIFATHRPDMKKAKTSLKDIESRLKKLQKDFGYTRLIQEGAYNAAVEEYVEAQTFFTITSKKKIEKIKGIQLSTASYLGGLSDLTGELVRQAVSSATKKEFEQVSINQKIINDIMQELIEFDMTGYLRTKYDQARNNLRKIEQISYEISLTR